MMLRRNILMFHQAALGDFIITWPLAMALARIFAQNRVMYVTHSQKGALAERVLRVESMDSEMGWHRLLMDDVVPKDLQPPAVKALEGAQLVISFTASEDDRLAAGVSKIAPQAKVISLDTKKSDEGHVTESIASQLTALPGLADAMRQMIRSVQTRGAGITLSPSDRIVIHPGAGKEANRWPAEHFLELARRFRDSGKPVRVLLGETEVERWPIHLIKQFEDISEVHRLSTLLDLLEELRMSRLFIGNDSGPGHLAGFIGVPTVSIFGATDPTRWKPIGPHVHLIQGQNLAAIDPHNVYTEATHQMGG